MQFKNFATAAAASEHVAQEILSALQAHPQLNLGLATGSTPVLLYQYLAAASCQSKTSWAQVQTFNLDEYLGLPLDHPQTYHVFMHDHLFSKVDLAPERTHFPGPTGDYDQLIAAAGGIDLQILGIGTNGHIGFNEPGSPLDSLTRPVALAPETIAVNAAKFFAGATALVPTQAVSMGIASILRAKRIVLLAFGAAKRAVVARLKTVQTFEVDFPASALVLHPDVTIITDTEANPQ